MRKTAITIMLLGIVFFICGKSGINTKTEVIDGVKCIHNGVPKWGNEPKVSLEFVRQIGELDTPDSNYELYKPNDIAKDKNGNIYVLDSKNYRIQKYDSSMKYMKTYGRRGEGPAEFKLPPFCIMIDSNENIIVTESLPTKHIVFNQNGVEIERKTYNHVFGRIIYIDSLFITACPPNDSTLLGFHNSAGNPLRTFVKKIKYNIVEGYNFDNLGNKLNFNVDTKNNIFVVFEIQNRIEKYSPEGTIIFKADRRLNYEETIKLKRDKNSTSVAPPYNTICIGMGIDNKDRIWTIKIVNQLPESIKNSDSSDVLQQARYYFKMEIFDNDGILLGYVPMPDKYALNFKIIGNSIYFFERDFNMCIYEYKIIEK